MMFLLVKFVQEVSGSWWSLFGGSVVSQFLRFLSNASIFNALPKNKIKKSISVLRIEDPEARSNEMKELAGPFTLVVKMSFYLIRCW